MPESYKISLYDSARDNVPTVVEETWEEVVETLTYFPEPRCDRATCRGRDCPAKMVEAWSPADVVGRRANANVRGVSLAVFDVDHVAAAALDDLRAALAGYRHAIHSTHSHAPPGDCCVRVVVPLSRPALPDEYPRVRRAIACAFGIPVDPQTKDLARIYFKPTRRADLPPGDLVAEAADGDCVDVDEAIASAAAIAGTAPPRADAPPRAAGEPVDLAGIRGTLAAVRRAKAASRDARHAEQAEILRRVLDGEALAAPGERDAVVLRAAGLLAYNLDDAPWPVVLEVLRPSLAAMDVQPEGLEHWAAVARDKYERQLVGKVESTARRDQERERLRDSLRGFAARPAAATAAADGSWVELLALLKDGSPRACERNAILAFSRCPSVAGTLRWDERRLRISASSGPLAGVAPESFDMFAANWLQCECEVYVPHRVAGAAAYAVARASPFDGVADYLRGLAWDGEPRVESFLTEVAGAEDSPYVRRASRSWLISLAARGLSPGCKVDDVLVLEGPQGARKSSLLEALGGEWYASMSVVLGDKDSMMLGAASWVVELAELASLGRGDLSKIKSFIACRVDKFRPPYGHETVEYPRRCVFVGTTNESQYLSDRTGNRRFRPVVAGKIDLDRARETRDQVFAEAAHLFLAGERWWLEGAEAAEADARAGERIIESAVESFTAAIRRWWVAVPPEKRRRVVSADDIAQPALSIEAKDLDVRARMQIGHAMAKLGFRSVQVEVDERRERRYEASDRLMALRREVSGLTVYDGEKKS